MVIFKSFPSWKFKEFVKIKKRETSKKNWIKNNSNENEKYIITEVKIWINILHKKFKPIICLECGVFEFENINNFLKKFGYSSYIYSFSGNLIKTNKIATVRICQNLSF